MLTFYPKLSATIFLMVTSVICALAQTTVSGTIKDSATGEPLAGANLIVKGTIAGTISTSNGTFALSVAGTPPFTLSVSLVGYATQDVQVSASQTNLDITLVEQSLLGQDVVVSASRVEENILKSPVTIEKMDLIAIKQASAPDYYDNLANMKGIQVNNGSMNMTSVNTRGFATIANTRFVQLVDGMDTQAPLLNFPTGNIMGLTELDAESIEIVPGAASALYGPNAFNGIMIQKSKSPFEYQGLSAQIKGGVTNSTAGGSHPMQQYGFRYAKAINDRLAVKVNFSYFKAYDWTSNDYKTDKENPSSHTDLSKNPNFDGLNLYGDESKFNIPIGGPFGTLNVARTGFKESQLLDNHDAKTIKGDAAIHYRITNKIEASYTYRYGGGNSIYQGQAKYALRNFNQQFHKLELKGDNWFVRGYVSATNAGKSYNMDALGAYVNEALSPTATKWAPDYGQAYVLALQGYNPFTGQADNSAAGNPAAANAEARKYADRNIVNPTTGAYATGFQDTVNKIRKQFFQKKPQGAAFYDNSKLYHAEAYYNFTQVKWAEIIAGGNFRQYSLFSNATIFDEAPVDANSPKRIHINQFGMYTQIAKTIAQKLKVTGSIRYDKMDDFKGHFTPRVSAVYEFLENQNIRASFQTGFRLPDTQAQYIFFNNPGGILLGGNPKAAERYNIYGPQGAYTLDSYNAFIASGGTLNADGTTSGGTASDLKRANLSYIKPEQLFSYEVGYKGVIAGVLLIDLNYYYSSYNNFLGEQYVVSATPTPHQGATIGAGTVWYPYANSPYKLTSQGVGLGVTYNLPKNFTATANYNFATFSGTQTNDFQAGFNTPKNRVSVGLANRKIAKRFGFGVNYRYQQDFLWQSSYGVWQVPHYGVVDAQINYRTPFKATVKIGGTNIGGHDYRTNFGAPFIGQTYFMSLTFDNLLN